MLGMELHDMKCETETNNRDARAAAERAVSLWLVDDNAELRGILAENFSLEPGIDCSRQFSSAEELLAALETGAPPDVVLLDVNMRGMRGVDAIAPIKRLAPRTRVLMLTTFYDSHDALTAFRAGASGFLLKSYDFSRIAQAVADQRDVWSDKWFRMKNPAGLRESGETPSPVTIPETRTASSQNHGALPLVIRLSRTVRGLFRREASM